MRGWIKRHKFWTVWLVALGVMFTLIGVVAIWPFGDILMLSAACYGVYRAVGWFTTRPPDQTVPQRAVEWSKSHKFWTTIMATILTAFPLSIAGIVAFYSVVRLCGLAVGIYGFWWLSQRGKRKNESRNEGGA